MNKDADPVLDALQVADLLRLDQGRGAVYARFVDVFLSGAGSRMDALRMLAHAADAKALAAAAHALKGSASNVGAARLAALFGRIEKAAERQDLAAAQDSMALLAKEFAAAREALCTATG